MSTDIAARTLAKITWRLIPFLAILYFAAFIDRVNVGFAAPQMNRDLGFSAYVYGLGSGIFFIGYCLFEVPSNLLLHRVGARRWIARIMLTWAVLAAGMAAVKTPAAFYVLRFLLGVAEAGFFPGIVYYLTGWVPAARRAQLVGLFMVAIPISTALGGPLSSLILGLDGSHGLAGWQWLFLIETLPSALLGFLVYRFLPDTPADAAWLSEEEKSWLLDSLRRERERVPATVAAGTRAALTNPRVLSLGLCYFGIEIALYGVIFWIPQIFKSLGYQESHLGYWVAIPYLIAAAAMVWWCRHSDRSRERIWHIVAAALAAFTGIAGSALLGGEAAYSLVAITVGAAGTLAVLPIFWTLPAAILRGAAAAGAIALINALGNVGGFVGPFVMGWMKDATGNFTYGLLLIASGALLCAAVALAIGHDAAVEHGAAETTI